MLQIFIVILLNGIGEAVNCHLPRDRGYSCDEDEKMLFYYDSRIGVCQPMRHHGCGGNENKFSTAAECQEKCKSNKNSTTTSSKDKELVVTECKLQTDAKISEVAQKCDNGCPQGYQCNENNKCCPMQDYICSLPADNGHDNVSMKHYRRYVYQPGLKNCIRFSYFGSGGNFNNFPTYNDCKDFCMEKSE